MHKQTNKQLLWVLDFDRCLGGTPALYDLFVNVIQDLGIATTAQLKDARQYIEQTGGSFDVLNYLYQNNLVDDELYQRVAAAYLRRAKAAPVSMLEPGAGVFLERLHNANHSCGILSYGDERWQRLKIAASGLERMSAMITDEKSKGRLIALWYDDARGVFDVPSGITMHHKTPYGEVVLVDDKAVAFDGLPSAARGYWLQSHKTLLPSQKGSVPGNVRIVRSFQEIIDLEGL